MQSWHDGPELFTMNKINLHVDRKDSLNPATLNFIQMDKCIFMARWTAFFMDGYGFSQNLRLRHIHDGYQSRRHHLLLILSRMFVGISVDSEIESKLTQTRSDLIEANLVNELQSLFFTDPRITHVFFIILSILKH